jgi:hypothetical protein
MRSALLYPASNSTSSGGYVETDGSRVTSALERCRSGFRFLCQWSMSTESCETNEMGEDVSKMHRIEKKRMSDDPLDLVFRKARTSNAFLFPERILRRFEQDANYGGKRGRAYSVCPIDVLKSRRFDG